MTIIGFERTSCSKCERANVIARKKRMELMTVSLCEIRGPVYPRCTPQNYLVISYLILKMGKMGHFKKFEHEKVGHFKKLARDQF